MTAPGLEIIVVAFVAFWLLVILGSLAIPFWVAKGRWRLLLLLPIVGFWSYQYHEQFQKPAAMKAWHLAGREQCRLESKALPKFISTDGFLDEGVGISEEIILSLFSERQLKFVEIYFPNAGGRFGHQIELNTAKAIAQPYVHLALSKKGDPNCVRLMGSQEDRERRVPFLPDTCLAATYLKEPTARYVVLLEREAEFESKKYGRWTLIDRSTSTQVSSITTTETRSEMAVTGRLYKPEYVPELVDCAPLNPNL